MRNEYPRPQFVRNQWQSLNGQWEFQFDYENEGLKERWYEEGRSFDQSIQVPFAYQTLRSGLSNEKPSEVVWYKRQIEIDSLSGRYLLHFGAVDFYTIVYLNGSRVGEHRGGHTSFSFDVTDYLQAGSNTLTVYCEDSFDNEWITRGKQYWKLKSESIWYTNTTGIWQTVWLENVSETYLQKVKIDTDIDAQSVTFYPRLNDYSKEALLEIVIRYKGELINKVSSLLMHDTTKITVDVLKNRIMNTNAHGNGWLWSPENPNLFDVEYILKDGETVLDKVESYFGMRKISVEDGIIMLNNRPYYQKLVLDQGYWPNSLLTAETDQYFVKDIELSKAMGFNGCRKHQKVEDPRFFYHCDRLGFLVWAECASSANFDERAVSLLANEWNEIIDRDYNHPSIIAWTPMNESWGVSEINYCQKQQAFAQMMYYFVKSQDQSRLVVVNDGWEMLKSDIIGIHNYTHGPKDRIDMHQKFIDGLETVENLLENRPARRQILLQPETYQNEPIMLTEFGGIAYTPKHYNDEDWGYTSVQNAEDYLEEYQRIMDAIGASKALQGFCYTQLTDVEQETNGLVTYQREEKVPLSSIKAINERVGG